MNWAHAWDQLHNLIPPEVTHYYHNVHPGVNWWLKCAVPMHADQPLWEFWCKVAQAHEQLVHICDTAWDWHGNQIPGCASVWIHKDHDVILHVDTVNWYYDLIPFMQGQSYVIEGMQEQIVDDCDPHTWQDINSALHLLATHVSDNQAHVRRKQFKVIHGKKTTSHKRARSNLDRE